MFKKNNNQHVFTLGAPLKAIAFATDLSHVVGGMGIISRRSIIAGEVWAPEMCGKPLNLRLALQKSWVRTQFFRVFGQDYFQGNFAVQLLG